MKEKFTYLFYRGLLATFFLACSVITWAQPPGGPPPGGGGSTGTTPPCWDPPCIPIDGGIGFLIAAGAFLGIKKLYGGTKG